MSYTITTATQKIYNLKSRLRAIPGGTSAGKTIGIIQVLIDLAQRDKTSTLTSITSESFPHLRRGAMRDFLDIMEVQQYFNPTRWSKTDFTYTFETGSKIEFFSADQPAKVRGPRRDRLFINEANNVPFETFEQLEVRTKDFIFFDWNPTSVFWYYEEVQQKRNDVAELTLTYLDNEALDKAIVTSIEQRKNRKGWWKVYGEGQLGEVEGRIYTGWQQIDSIPHEARFEGYGMDFGYNPDPTAIVGVYYYNGGYILDELFYQIEASNKEIADTLKNFERGLIVADCAEKDRIADIKAYGLNIIPCRKGPGSLRAGITMMQGLKISYTKQSFNLRKEYQNYLWETDQDGKILAGIPEDRYNHCLDAARYRLELLIPMHVRRDMITRHALRIQHKTRANIAV